MDAKTLEILVCPVCKSPLLVRKDHDDLVCKPCRLAYPVRDGMFVMLVDEATPLPADLDL
ncbi:MAG: Trm112 family protein [Pseudomonadota bacterium]|nr:Trm112 family protein [Pseudomonadota bacterium]